MVDVLNLEWHSGPTRDNYITTLVCNYLTLKGYSVKRGCVFEGVKLLLKHKPKLVFLANGIGAPENFQVVKLAKKIGCLVVTGTSEGNIQLTNITQMTWGWNKARLLFEDINLQWSFRAKRLIISQKGINSNKIKVSGGIGFDIYKIKNDTLQVQDYFKTKYEIPNDKKIIGFACWDFGPFYEEDYRFNKNKKILSEREIEQRKNDGIELNKILIEFINKNKQYHYIIKEHPGSLLGEKASAIEGISKCKTVTIIKHEEAAEVCIKASDIWLGYETTTALEAWLLGKTTLLINPSGVSFKRASLYKGSVFATDYDSLQAYIDEYFKNGYINDFVKLEKQREHEIKKVIEWSDGCNHQRAGNHIIELLNANNKKKLKLNFMHFYFIRLLLKELIISNNILGPIFFRNQYNFISKKLKSFSIDEQNQIEESILKHQIEFYRHEYCGNQLLPSISKGSN